MGGGEEGEREGGTEHKKKRDWDNGREQYYYDRWKYGMRRKQEYREREKRSYEEKGVKINEENEQMEKKREKGSECFNFLS